MAPSRKRKMDVVPVPEIPFHEAVIGALWRHHCANPQLKAFINAEDPEDSVTFEKFHQIIHSLANFLREDVGFTQREICFLCLPNCWQYAAVFLAVSMCGGVTTGMNEDATIYETQRQLADSSASVVVTTSYNLSKLAKASDKCPNLKAVILVDQLRGKAPPTTFRVYQWTNAMHKEPIFERSSVDIDPKEDLIVLPYSSGTTGVPKGVMITHYNYTAQAIGFAAHAERHITPFIEGVDSNYTISYLPLYHAYGFFGLCAAILRGQTQVILSHFTPQLLFHCIQKYRIRYIGLVPALVTMLAKSPLVNKYDLSTLSAISNGAGPLSKEVAEAVVRRLPHIKVVNQGYGMTELTCVCHASVMSGDKSSFGSVGRILPNNEQKIINPQTGRECEIGEPGELYVRGPTVMKGYWKNKKATREMIDDEGWLRTGDIVVERENGDIFVLDRNKELIKVNSFQVPPAELEALLLTHHGISDAAVIGIPDESRGEAPRAYVVKKATAQLTEEDVVKFVAERVSHYKRLDGGVEFLHEIQRNPTGKILRRMLKDRYQSAHGKGKL